MKRILVLCTLILLSSAFASPDRTVRIVVQGDSSRLADFVASCKEVFPQHGLVWKTAQLDEEYDYNVLIAQETSLSGASAAVVVVDRKGKFVASVVRAGRWSGKGALNASAKELAKKLAILTK